MCAGLIRLSETCSEKGDACRAEKSWREMFGSSAEGFLYRIHDDHSLHLLGRDRKLTWHLGGLASYRLTKMQHFGYKSEHQRRKFNTITSPVHPSRSIHQL